MVLYNFQQPLGGDGLSDAVDHTWKAGGRKGGEGSGWKGGRQVKMWYSTEHAINAYRWDVFHTHPPLSSISTLYRPQ